MKRLLIALGFSVAALCSTNVLATSMSVNNIGVVDMKEVINNSSQVKNINQNLQKQFSGRKNKIIAMTKDLQKELQDYQKNKAVMSADDLAKLKTKITKQEMDLRNAQIQYQQDLYSAQNKEMSSFIAKVKNAVKEVAMKEKLTLVLPKNAILYAKGDKDITNNVESILK